MSPASSSRSPSTQKGRGHSKQSSGSSGTRPSKASKQQMQAAARGATSEGSRSASKVSTAMLPPSPPEKKTTPAFFLKEGGGAFERDVIDAGAATLKYQEEAPAGPFAILGPVIGMCTESSARVLIETNLNVVATCFLTDSDGQQYAVKKAFKKKRPAAFKFEGLRADTYYKVSMNIPTPGLVKSGFRTLPDDWSVKKREANFAFVASNKYRITRDEDVPGTDLWRDLYKKAAHGEIDYCIHMGDNGVTPDAATDKPTGLPDSRWVLASKILDGVPREEWQDYYEEITETCRTVYRDTWNHPPTRHTLANVPNLMILDDHDIRDDWGDWECDRDPTSKEFFIACCFYNVYNEYQRNLYEDYESVKFAYDACKVGQAHHFHVFGDIGIMMTESRAAKTFHRNYYDQSEDLLPLLGNQQWKDLDSALSPDGYLSDCRMLFVISPQAPCAVATQHIAEASLMLQNLFDWRASDPGRREVCVVSGNLTEGGYTDIVDLRYAGGDDDRLDRMKQVTTAAISKNSLSAPRESPVSRKMVSNVGKWHQFYHYNWTPMRNFNCIRVYAERDPQAEEKHGFRGVATRFDTQMFAGEGAKRKQFPAINSAHRAWAPRGGIFGFLSGLGLCSPGACGQGDFEFVPQASASRGSVSTGARDVSVATYG